MPVTEISDNGFTNCANLTRVRIPYTVTRIGNNAFANCKNLEEINGMPKVENIGNNAFAMCTKLDNLILPNTINSLGSTILRNNSNTVYSRMAESEMMTLNSNWKSSSNVITIYGNDIVMNEVFNENNELIGYSVKMDQNLNTGADFVLGDTYNGLPLLEIEQFAFYCNEFNSFTLKHGEIVAEGNAVNETAQSCGTGACNHVVNIASGAFSLMQVNHINLLVDVTFNDSLVNGDENFEYENKHSIEIFSDSSAESVTLPNNIDYIPKSAFANCLFLTDIKNIDTNIEVNHISSNIKIVGSNAFDGCIALENLYIPDSVITMGEYVFNQWGTQIEQAIIFEDLYEAPIGEEGYNWAQYWKDGIGDKAKLEFIKIAVTFDKQGGNPDIGTDMVEAMYHQDMPDATAPENGDYIFDGYYSEPNGAGIKYYDKDMHSVTPWDQKSPTATIYAKWLDAPSKSHIIFYKADGEGGSDWVDATFGQPMPKADKPIRTGYTFAGYFSATGTMYYDAEMSSAHDWDISEDAVILSAHWQNNRYKVNLDPVGGSGGENEITVFFGIKSDAKFSVPQLKGYTFDGYYTKKGGEGNKYFDSNMLGTCKWDIVPDEEGCTLYAHWVPTNYTIIFDKQGGTGGASEVTNCHYNEEMPSLNANKSPVRNFYNFTGYYTKIQGDNEAIRYYNYDMTSAHTLQYLDSADENNNITLYAHWEAISYNVKYVVDNLQLPANVINDNPKKVSIDDFGENTSLPLHPIDNHGYSISWEKSEITKDMLGKEIVIHGTATLHVYKITYILNGGLNNGGNKENFTAAEHVILEDITSANEGEFFAGWLLSGTNRILTNLDGIYEDITLEATWSEFKTIRITKDSLSKWLPEIVITEQKASIIFETSFTDNLTIKVSPNTTMVGINGNGRYYNLNIDISQRATDFTLLLYAIGINAHSEKFAISMPTNTLHLYTSAGVVIKGCTRLLSTYRKSASGIAAISCNSLFIYSSDSLWIQGGNGLNGYNASYDNGLGLLNGGDGGDGASAIIANIEVRIGCSNVLIAGGLAGNGGNAFNSSYYKGMGGKGAMPIKGGYSPLGEAYSPKVYIWTEAENVYLYKTNDGANGNIGKNPSNTYPPVDPNPPTGDLYIPPIDWDINLPPIDGQFPVPTPPIPPIIIK